MKAHTNSPQARTAQTIIWLENDVLWMRILKRKNRRGGSGNLYRRCCCSGTANPLCAVHSLWPFLATLRDGSQPWSFMKGKEANKRLQGELAACGVDNAEKYHTHDIRRGHAEVNTQFVHTLATAVRACMHVLQDMRRSGHTLAQILRAGQWRSAAFVDYLDQCGLEEDLVFETAIEEPMEWLN